MYDLLLHAPRARTWLALGVLGVTLGGACSLDREPASLSRAADPAPIRLRDPDRATSAMDAAAMSGDDAAIEPACSADSCEHGGSCSETSLGLHCDCTQGWTGLHCENRSGRCTDNPCENGGECEDGDGGFVCVCATGFSGETCDARCGNGIIEPSESCDEGADNGTPGHCDARCSEPAGETLSIRQPDADLRVVNPIFFDWELVGARAGTQYCHMLMTDKAHTPEDRIGEQAFYADSATELVLTLNSQRYRGPFSFAIISVACTDPEAVCDHFDCYPGQECALPCLGRTITSETRGLLGVRP